MSRIVQWSQYEQISTDKLNNMSKYMIEEVLKDYSRYCIVNSKSVIYSTGTVVEQNLGTDYNTKINAHITINSSGVPAVRTTQTTLSHSVPSTNPRIDVIEAEIGYANQNQQSRQFIDPNTGNISSVSTYTEFGLDATLSVIEGTEAASPTAPATTAGRVKVAEVFVDTAGGIANADIFNVDSEFGEANSSWTFEQALTVRLKPLQQHRELTILDHPDGSVTVEKLETDTIIGLRSFLLPATKITGGDYHVMHEITVPAGKTLRVVNMGIQIENGTASDSNVVIEAGTYSGSFSQQISTDQRDNDFTVSNTFAAASVVQFRIKNDNGTGSSNVTAHIIYIYE